MSEEKKTIVGLIPDSTGVLEWRVRTGLTGEYYGGIAYNPFVGILHGQCIRHRGQVGVYQAAFVQ